MNIKGWQFSDIVAIAAWVVFAISAVSLALAWRSVEVQSFLEVVRSAK